MADLSYNIDNLYRQAFPSLASKPLAVLEGGRDLGMAALDTALGNGFKVPATGGPSNQVEGYKLPAGGGPSAQLDFSGIQAVRVEQRQVMSYLGTPVFQPIFLVGDTYQMLGTGSKQGQVVEAPFETWMLPASATAEFNRPKEIAKSKPNGAFSSVKEMWGFNDWEVTIRGFLIHPDGNTFPEDDLKTLYRWEQVADSVAVDGDMFCYLGISRLVIERLSIGRIVGMPNMIPFQLQCVSDEALEISLQTNQLP